MQARQHLSALKRSQIAFFREISSVPPYTSDRELGGVRYVSGCPFPLWNGIMGTHLEDDPQQAINAALEPFRTAGLPMFWWTMPDDEPAELADHLARAGLVQVGAMPGMVLPLREARAVELPKGLNVRTVTSDADVDTFVALIAEVESVPAFAADFIARVTKRYGYAESLPTTNLIGCFDGQPVATASSTVDGDAVSIWNVATLPDFRGRGIGGAMTLFALEAARRRGAAIATLASSELGYSVYRRLGFQEICRQGIFHYAPSADA